MAAVVGMAGLDQELDGTETPTHLTPRAPGGEVGAVDEAQRYKTDPRPYQREEVEEAGDQRVRGLWWDPGCGKTKAVVDTVARLVRAGEVDRLLILAPTGVHRQWVDDELPKHMPDDVASGMACHIWQTARSRTKKHAAAFERALRSARRLAVLAISYDSMMTDLGRDAAWEMLRAGRCFYVADESQKIKTPGSKRTKRVLASARHARYLRALTGTPVDDNPFDLYSQVKFLDPAAWHPLGVRSFEAYKARFGIFKKGVTHKGGRRREFQEVVGYRDLGTLRTVLTSYGRRISKAEVLPDLPEKSYSKRYFDLSPVQRRMYDELASECRTLFREDGASVTAALSIVQLTRFQQITSGFVPADLEVGMRRVPGPNPRLREFSDFAEDVTQQGIVWCIYDMEVDDVLAELTALGQSAVRYDGRVSEQDRSLAKTKFRAGDAQWFVSKPSVGGTGLTLTEASIVAYYSVGWRLSDRIQSEARNDRIGQKNPILYVDFVASDTVDERKIAALRSKRDVASTITGDEFLSWI